MAEKIKVGELVCSGWKNEGRYKNPYVTIDAESKVELHRTMICKAIMVVPIKYREATGHRDNPSFKMKVYDGEDNLLDTFEESHEDEKGTFRAFDDEFRFEVDSDIFYRGPAPIELTYKCQLEAKLEIDRWDNEGNRISRPRVIRKTKTVTVHIRTEKVCDLTIWSGCSLSPAIWKQPYHIWTKCQNVGNEIIKKISCSSQHETGAALPMESPDRLRRRGEVEYVVPEQTVPFNSIEITKHWHWWKGIMTPKGPFKKKFYYPVFIKVTYQGVEGPPCKITEDVYATVEVSDDKREYAVKAYILWIEVAVLLAATVIGIFTFGIGAAVAAAAAAVVAIAAGYATEKAKDPVEYDKNYKKPHDHRKQLTALNIPPEVPEVVRTFMDSVNMVMALSQSINISFSRYMTGLLKKDKKAARLQIDSCETMLSQIEDEIIALNENLFETQQVAAENQVEIDPETINEKLEKLKKEGLSESEKKSLIEKGLPNESIEAVEERIKEMKPEDVRLDASPSIEKLYHHALGCHIDSLKQVKEIRRIQKLKGNDILRELLNTGLISYAEFRKRMNRLNYEFNYPLVEIEGIDAFYKAKLAAVGITTTQKLLERCAKRSQRISLAKKTGISRKLILEWANLADLMRIRGVSEEYSDMLEEVGVDTIVELSTRKPDVLYEKIKKYVKESRWVRRAPSKAQVKTWIEGARKLDRFLEY